MPNDEKIQAILRDAVLKNVKKFSQLDKTGELMMTFLSYPVDFKDNEEEQDVILCEDDGESTVIRVREDSGEGYCILDFDDDWASDEWWENNSFVLPEDVALALAHDYLQQFEPGLQSDFIGRDEAKRLIFPALKKLSGQDKFAEELAALLADFDRIAVL